MKRKIFEINMSTINVKEKTTKKLEFEKFISIEKAHVVKSTNPIIS